jgi:hypothetical protein
MISAFNQIEVVVLTETFLKGELQRLEKIWQEAEKQCVTHVNATTNRMNPAFSEKKSGLPLVIDSTHFSVQTAIEY